MRFLGRFPVTLVGSFARWEQATMRLAARVEAQRPFLKSSCFSCLSPNMQVILCIAVLAHKPC